MNPREAGEALKTAKAALRASVLQALAEGQSEASVARDAGITRMTVRAWRKQDREIHANPYP